MSPNRNIRDAFTVAVDRRERSAAVTGPPELRGRIQTQVVGIIAEPDGPERGKRRSIVDSQGAVATRGHVEPIRVGAVNNPLRLVKSADALAEVPGDVCASTPEPSAVWFIGFVMLSWAFSLRALFRPRSRSNHSHL